MDIVEERKTKKQKTTDQLKPQLNPNLLKNLEALQKLYKSNVALEQQSSGSMNLITNPFKCCVFNDFISDTKFLDALREEILQNVEFYPKNNDLYCFKQSEDLKFLNFDHCSLVTRWLKTEVLNLIKKITGIDLYDNQIDITASKYEFTDTLLCHDDNIDEEDRKVAFILYLVDKDWTDEDGGHLDLIGQDENQQPTTTQHVLIPKFNNFVFFEVSPSSFHQVREVLSSNKIRLSVNGWFKGERTYKITPYREQFICPIKCKDFFVEEQMLKNWINNLYLTDEIEKDVREEFENQSQTLLLEFINKEKFDALENALNHCNDWILQSPANRRRFFVLDEEKFPKILNDFLSVLKSEQFFLILGSMTGLKLHPLNPDNLDDSDTDQSDTDQQENRKLHNVNKSNPRCSIEVRKFEHGCYTLIHDYDGEVLDKNPKLDVKFYLNHKFESKLESGGCMHYLEKNEDIELLTVEPVNNALSLVYRDDETVRFHKYMNSKHKGTFHEVSMIFQE